MTQSRPYIIGLTGGIAAGKSNLARALREAGVTVIDADAISHGLTAPRGPALPDIRRAFGEGVFAPDGTLDRRALGAAVFGNPQALARLNAIMHPLVLAEIRRQIEAHADQPALVIDVPLLYEVGWHVYCDEEWCAWATPRVQVRRIMRRDGHSLMAAIRRVRSQMPIGRKRRRADHVIDTTGTRQQSARKALRLWQDALRRTQHV